MLATIEAVDNNSFGFNSLSDGGNLIKWYFTNVKNVPAKLKTSLVLGSVKALALAIGSVKH